jgi:hypothetical protein
MTRKGSVVADIDSPGPYGRVTELGRPMIMEVMANAPRVSRKGMLAVVAVLVVLLSVFSLSAPTARATETNGEGRSGTPDVGVMAWTPSLNLVPPGESVIRHVSTEDRNAILHACLSGYVCVAAGEGNGLHTIYSLYNCPERVLSNFIGDGAVSNHQTGGAQVVLKYQDGRPARTINVGQEPVRVDWDPIYYLDPC